MAAGKSAAKLETDPLHTPLCDLLGIEHPVLQAGMGMIARGRLAAAVSEAGGLGVIGSGHLTVDELRDEIRIAKRLTDKPFGVDILFATVDARGDEVASYTREVEEQVQTVLDERVPVLVSGLGNPILAIDSAHELGIVVMSVVGNTRQAVRLVDAGVDAVIGQGHEAGGHTGPVGTIVLIPQLVDSVDVPVVAAGGLVDGRGLAASLALGATGVWMGTRFIATEEAHAHDNYKHKIASISETGTVVTRAHSGKPCRLIKNRFTEEWESRTNEIEPFPLQLLHVGKPASEIARLQGDVEHGSAPAGQGSGLIHDVPTAREVVEDIVAGARATLGRLAPGGA
jgi:enoyl-[acyl-carrier protein] reductase II